jgi:hypothetical protein
VDLVCLLWAAELLGSSFFAAPCHQPSWATMIEAHVAAGDAPCPGACLGESRIMQHVYRRKASSANGTLAMEGHTVRSWRHMHCDTIKARARAMDSFEV